MNFDGARLKQLRVGRKWDQHRLAEAARSHGVGITQSQISRYENGQEPSGRNLLALASALDVDASDLYGDTSDEEEEAASMPVFRGIEDMVAVLMPRAALRQIVREELKAAAS